MGIELGELLVVSDLVTHYETRHKERVYAVDGVSFGLAKGKVLGIAGESGCGKSTLALSLMGFYFPPLFFDSGCISVNGTDIMKLSKEQLRVQVLGREIAYIPQAAMNALNPTRKVIHFVEDVLREHTPGMSRKDIRALASERFAVLNLPTRVLEAYPTELSGGMKQRTVIAISTILSPKVLIADEPTSALDVTSQKAVVRLLKELMAKGIVESMVFITHELPLLYHVADDIFIMYAGQVVEKGTAREVVFDPLHPYSIELMGSMIMVEEGMKGRALACIPGAPPNLKNRMVGCRFAERCRHAAPECSAGAVPVVRRDGREYRCIRVAEERSRLVPAALVEEVHEA